MTAEEARDNLRYLISGGCTDSHFDFIDEIEMAIEALEEVEQYRVLGTVEELKEAKEKQIPKKPLIKTFQNEDYPICPNCLDDWNMNEYGSGMKCCWECGQRIDWSEEE